LQIIRSIFSQPATIWEIGSGTGQHGCSFARHLPPLILDVTDEVWPCTSIDALFTANTLHIMSRDEVRSCWAPGHIPESQRACLYLWSV
jgi:hypothetical protein